MTLIIISVVCCSKSMRPKALLIISSLISSIEDSQIFFSFRIPHKSHTRGNEACSLSLIKIKPNEACGHHYHQLVLIGCLLSLWNWRVWGLRSQIWPVLCLLEICHPICLQKVCLVVLMWEYLPRPFKKKKH